MSDRDKPAPYRIPEIDPDTEMLTYSSYCPVNLRADGKDKCSKKGRKMGTYDNENQARDNILSHLTSPQHEMGQIEAEKLVHEEADCIWIDKCAKSEWYEGPDKEEHHEGPPCSPIDTHEQAGRSEGSRAARKEQRPRSSTYSSTYSRKKHRIRSSSYSRSGSSSSKTKPNEASAGSLRRPPAATGPAAPPATGPAGHCSNLQLLPMRNTNSSAKDAILQALIRSQTALRSAARMARSAGQAFEDEAHALRESKLAFAMDRHKHQSSYVQFI